MAAEPGSRIGPYEVVKELGRGGMGVVLVVRHPQIPRPLAMKLIIGDITDDALARFGREAQVMARVRHRNVVTVHQVGRAAEGPFIVTELVEGRPLDGRLEEGGPLEPREAARIVKELADGLAACHAAGVVHRDLKPANVLLRDDGTPVVLDFGVARDESAERLTKTGQMVGTPAFMAPEQAEGLKDIDARVDVYGLGAILYCLLAGHGPFHDGGSLVQVLHKVLNEDPRWPRELRPEVPVELDAVVRVAMAKTRAARHAGAAALRDDLDRFLKGERPWAADHVPAARRRPRWPLALAGASVLFAAAAGAAVALGSRSSSGGGQAATEPAGPDPVAQASRELTRLRTLAAELRAQGGPERVGHEVLGLLRRLEGAPLDAAGTTALAVLRKELAARPVRLLPLPDLGKHQARAIVSSDDEVLVYRTDGRVALWRLDQEQPVGPAPTPAGSWHAAALLPGGDVLLGGQGLAVVRRGSPAPEPWEHAARVKELLERRPAPLIRAIAVDAPGQRVAIGGGHARAEDKGPVEEGAWGAALVVPLVAGGRAWKVDGAPRPVFALAWGERGLLVASGWPQPDTSNDLQLHTEDGRVVALNGPRPTFVRTLAPLAGDLWAAGLDVGQVKLIELAGDDLQVVGQVFDEGTRGTMEGLKVAHPRPVTALSVHRGALLTGGELGRGKGSDLRSWEVGAPPGRTEHQAFTPLRAEREPAGIRSIGVTRSGLLVVATHEAVEVWLLP